MHLVQAAKNARKVEAEAEAAADDSPYSGIARINRE